VLKVSRSAYYSWLVKTRHKEADFQKQNQMEALITQTFQEHRRRYGVRRLVVELKAKGWQVGKYQVQKVLHRDCKMNCVKIKKRK